MTDDEKTHEIGAPEPDPPTEEAPPRRRARRLLRSRDDRVISGVAGGLGRYFDIDPVIVRIAFAVSIALGGFGLLAYVAAMIFVPSERGGGPVAPRSRGRTVARVAGITLLVIAALGAFCALVGMAAFATGVGWGLGVVAVIVLIGVALIALSFRGGVRWLIVPALALSIGAAAAAAADLDLEGGIGERDHRPVSAEAIPDEGYELGVGRLAVDLRDIDWSPTRVVRLDVRVGGGQAVIAVPSDVCVAARAHADAGDLRVAGQQSDGWDVESTVGVGSGSTPRLELDAEVGFGQIVVLNDDDAEIGADHEPRFAGPTHGDDPVASDANAEACAG